MLAKIVHELYAVLCRAVFTHALRMADPIVTISSLSRAAALISFAAVGTTAAFLTSLVTTGRRRHMMLSSLRVFAFLSFCQNFCSFALLKRCLEIFCQ